MVNRARYFLLAFIVFIGASHAFSQDSAAKRFHIALFSPFYLDSAFDESNAYKPGANFPKYLNAGLEFYEGAQLAIDSLQKEGVDLDITVYDTKSARTPFNTVIASPDLANTDLVIGNVNANEAKALANVVAKKNIPFINATYPNDAGVTNNPNFIVLNPTIYTHCAAMYRFIQKNYSLAPVVVFRKKGAQEDRLIAYFQEIARTTNSVPLKIKYVTIEDSVNADAVVDKLDENRPTICIAGSLDVTFGTQLAEALSSVYASHPSVLFGMPTWWDAPAFAGDNFKSLEIFFSTPFYNSPNNALVTAIQDYYKTKFYSRPTDMVFRGYETLYHFAHLLILNDKNLGSSLSDKRYRVFNEFDIQPVIDPKSNTLNYFENKKIYFIKKVDGVVTMIY